MQAKTFVGKIRVVIGEYENDVTKLMVANSRDAAWSLLEEAAQCHYGDENTPKEGDGYYANGGEVLVEPVSLEEIGLSTFLELKTLFSVRCQANVKVPDESVLETTFSELVQPLTQALNRKEKLVTHSQVLNALATAYGHKRWKLLKDKLATLDQAIHSAKIPGHGVAAAGDEMTREHQLNQVRRQTAESLRESYDFGATVAAFAGWEQRGSVLQCAVFLEQDDEDEDTSRRVILSVAFEEGSADVKHYFVD
jgi:hypothetical protein